MQLFDVEISTVYYFEIVSQYNLSLFNNLVQVPCLQVGNEILGSQQVDKHILTVATSRYYFFHLLKQSQSVGEFEIYLL